MRIQGGKSRLGKRIAETINASERQCYLEPFVGGANVLIHVDKRLRFASDADEQLIHMYQCVQEGWVPPSTVGPEEYELAKSGKLPAGSTAFIKYACSWGAKPRGGYARANGRNFADESGRWLQSSRDRLASVHFSAAKYNDLVVPKDAVMYCDPPYAGLTGYGSGDFSHREFWAWCDYHHDRGVEVYVSESTAPSWWEPVWTIDGHKSGYGGRSKATRPESLWRCS